MVGGGDGLHMAEEGGEAEREGFEAKKEVGVSWRVGYVGIFWWDEEDKLYTATNINQCSGPDFMLRLKRPRGGDGIARPAFVVPPVQRRGADPWTMAADMPERSAMRRCRRCGRSLRVSFPI